MTSKRFGIAAICSFALGMSLIAQPSGWAQLSYFALVRGLSEGTAQIDKWHWETNDKSWINGHFFSVKSPGMPVLLLPVYELLEASGFGDLSRSAGRNSQTAAKTSPAKGNPDLSQFGGSLKIRTETRATIIESKLVVWALTLFGSLLPAVAMLLLVRRLAERWVPGVGAASALALGMGTVLMPFSGLMFSHLLASLMLFAGFAILLRERESEGSLRLVAAGGLLAGLAVFTEYPLAFGGAVIGLYAAFRRSGASMELKTVLARGAAFAAGVLTGVLPVAIYNLWAFGSVTTMSYKDTVTTPGRTGHDVVGLVNGGLFGIEVPEPMGLVSLLFSPRGLVALTPVLVMAAVGVFLMFRRGMRAEALTIGGVFLAYWVYVAGYIWPFGGAVPGPRYLIPALPFLGLGLPFAFKRFPSTTMVMGVVGAVSMVAAVLTKSLVLAGDLGIWWVRLEDGPLTRTVFSFMGFGHGWLTVAPSLAFFLAAPILAAAATKGLDVGRDRMVAIGSLAAWACLAWFIAPEVDELNNHEPVRDLVGLPHQLILVALVVSAVALTAAAVTSQRSRAVSQPSS